MIKLQNQVPSIYSSASRDFQYLCWLINIVLNSVKHNVDDIYNMPKSKSDPGLTELLALTLGFKVKRSYDQAQLVALVNVLPLVLKYKGTTTAIDIVGTALVNTVRTNGECKSEVEGNVLKITLPAELVDVALITDLIPYILPAGLGCTILRKNSDTDQYMYKLDLHSSYFGKSHQELSFDENTGLLTGPAALFDTDAIAPTFSNYTGDSKLNIALLDNNIIPSGPFYYSNDTSSVAESDMPENVSDSNKLNGNDTELAD